MEKEITLSKNLNELFKKRGLSVSVTAKRIGVNKNTLESYLNGVLPRGLVTLLKVADDLEISLSELVFGFEDKTPEKTQSPLVGKYELTIKEINDTLSGGQGNR